MKAKKLSGLQRSFFPWLALALLFLSDHIAGKEAKEVKDTHQRLDRIYKELGLRQQKPQLEDRGCAGGRPRTEDRSLGLKVPPLPRSLSYLLVGVVLAVMLIPLYYALRRNDALPSATGPSPDDPDDDDDQAGHASRSPQRAPWPQSLEECRHLLYQGRAAEAFASLHCFALMQLSHQNYLCLGESTTNWEYVRQLSSHTDLQHLLDHLTLAAEQAVLGKQPPSPEHYRSLEQQLQGHLT